jgi:maleate isomerase
MRSGIYVTAGWRARIGILRTEHDLLDEDAQAYAPPGVALLTARTRVEAEDSVASLERLAEDPELERTTAGFRRVRVDAVAYVCTAVGFIRGLGGAQALNRRLTTAAGAPATCAISASVAALRVSGAQRISVGSPYSGEIHRRLLDFLGASGFEMAAEESLGLVGVLDGAAVCDTSLETIRRLAHSVDRTDSDAVYLGCTAFRSADIVDALEQDLGKPVVMATQATMWHALELAGVHAGQTGLGSIFQRRLPSSERRHAVKGIVSSASGPRANSAHST